jgi:hypothetical protein
MLKPARACLFMSLSGKMILLTCLFKHTNSLSLFYSARGQFDIYLPAGRHDNHCYQEKPVFKLTHYQTLLTCQGDAKAIF